MTAQRRSIVIIDDHSLFRQGIRALLESAFDIVGEGGTSYDALRLVAETSPDVLLLDVELPGIPAEQTITRVRRDHPEVAIVVLTMHNDVALERQLLRAGASHYVTKKVNGDDLSMIVSGATPAPATTRPAAPDTEAAAPTILTSRELDVLRMIAQAYTNRDISVQLHIAEGTVKRHTTNMYVKLGATSRIDAVRKAARLGLLDASGPYAQETSAQETRATETRATGTRAPEPGTPRS